MRAALERGDVREHDPRNVARLICCAAPERLDEALRSELLFLRIGGFVQAAGWAEGPSSHSSHHHERLVIRDMRAALERGDVREHDARNVARLICRRAPERFDEALRPELL